MAIVAEGLIRSILAAIFMAIDLTFGRAALL